VLDVPFAYGTLALNSTEAHAFWPQHIDILRELADTLSEGFQRAEDLAALQERNRELERELESRAERERRGNARFLVREQVWKMRRAEDIAAVLETVGESLRILGVPFVFCGVNIVVDKSTVPVKTGEQVAETIRRYNKAKVEFDVVSNPEFLREGFAVADLMNPDRVVVGTTSQRPVATMKEVYEPFKAPIICTDINSAELIKHAANSFLALKISYINAVAAVCEASGANVEEVASGIGLDERIGKRFLNAGLGFGGSCFPKDLSAFINIAKELGYDFTMLKEVQKINADQMDRFLKKITETLWVLKEKKLGILGLAFKQNTDDTRTSPAIELCLRLLQEGASLRVYDPKAMDKAKDQLPASDKVEYVTDMNAIGEGCDAIVIATEWPEFKDLDLEKARKDLSHPILFDGRNLFDPAKMEELGFIYKSVGR